MDIDKDIEAQLEDFLKECEVGKESIRSTLKKIAMELVSSDILLYNMIIHYKKTGEQKKIPPGYPPGAMEFGPFLYWLTNEKPPSSWDIKYQFIWYALQLVILDLVGSSCITKALYDDLIEYVKTTGLPADDGTMYGVDMYSQLDAHWLESVIHYLFYKAFPSLKAPFNSKATKPVKLSGKNPDNVKIAIIGDWGTGKYDPAKTFDNQDGNVNGPALDIMAAVMQLNPAPDYIIHLGDVYYAGTDNKALVGSKEEQDNFINVWSSTNTINFTLNSNHEMYGGGNGYFNVALSNDLFRTQINRSFFQLEYGCWTILGLDSAYYCDDDNLYMNGRITDNTQLKMLKDQADNNKNTIVMTHHNAMEYDGSETGKLWTDVTGSNALGAAPGYWYWGHIHEGIVYSDQTVSPTDSSKLRCVGHSAMPYGEAWGLLDNEGQTIPAIEYFANTPVDRSGKTSARVFNGFAMITLTNDTLTEQFYELDSSGAGVLKWPVAASD